MHIFQIYLDLMQILSRFFLPKVTFDCSSGIPGEMQIFSDEDQIIKRSVPDL